jgi:hypothetical protein
MWTGALVGIFVSLLGTGSAQLPPGRRMPPPGVMATSSASLPASAVTVMTWVARYGSDGAQQLELLVLWRGTPGWYLRGSGSSSSGGGGANSFNSSIGYGGLDLRLELQYQPRVANIQGTRVELRDDNVIFVDFVDTKGPTVVGTLRVDPALPQADGRIPRIDEVLGRSAEIVKFLRCDAELPDPRGQGAIERICKQLPQ